MATLFPVQTFNPGAVPTIQEMLLTLAEYVTATITTTSVVNQQFILEAIRQTLVNSIDIIDAYQIHTLMSQEYALLSRISGNSLGLSVADRTLINNRIASFNALANTIYPLNISLPFDVNQLNNGLPALQAYDILAYLIQFDFETPPLGLALTSASFIANSAAMTQAWLDALNFLTNNGTSYQITAYDPVNRMYAASLTAADLVSHITFPPAPVLENAQQMWNSLVALPSLLRVAALLYNDPSSQLSQSINTIKFVIYNLILETNSVLALFNVPNTVQQPITATLRAGETLLDFAARTTGDYTQWEAIAASNNLMPPYTGTIPAPGIATPGQKLFLPPFSINSPLANYNDAFLGTDIDIGFPFTELTNWSGDFSLIKGINNYLGALARVVLTPTGSLIYHTGYGSRLPAEVGNVQTASEAFLLSSFLKSALLSDSRTEAVNQITAYPVKFGQIVLTAQVTPYGSAAAVPFNLVIVPQSAAITRS